MHYPAVQFLRLLLWAFVPQWLVVQSSAASYTLQDSYVGTSFFSGFTFQTFHDPTHGRVDYVSMRDAQRAHLVDTSNTSFIVRVESASTLSPSSPGRKSIRIHSTKQYTTHILVADIWHMPTGCAVWPALWENGAKWPSGGEFDIIEGVNDIRPNLQSLHTSPGCTMSDTGEGPMKGYHNGNQGCGVAGNSMRDFGNAFNAAGGGWFVTERTNKRFTTWFWSRHDPTVPQSVKRGEQRVDTTAFGTPTALFVNSPSCNIVKMFGPHRIILNTSLCGDWAGSARTWSSSGCAARYGSSCDAFVERNPHAFREAYWNISAIRVYETVEPSTLDIDQGLNDQDVGVHTVEDKSVLLDSEFFDAQVPLQVVPIATNEG
ncbi:family 16 hypothetical endo-1,3(4)-beta-glucanase from glycoside hydrolase [Auriculariales sp. MPI-PUGE-AT-0066]|nr:family 16 hypothetical endo-1,3(4)-beta-glucanase from glycoside hydrolase [Auriculariales sp. MPI-PUGE-AT-0066]